MAFYVGFITMDPDWQRELGEKMRSGRMEARPFQIPEPLGTKVRELAQKLPRDCKIVARWSPALGMPTGTHHAIFAVETNDTGHLAWISNYYAGFLTFDWQLYMPTPV